MNDCVSEWLQILVFSSNPLYDGDRAREAESDNDPTTVYLVDKSGWPSLPIWRCCADVHCIGG